MRRSKIVHTIAQHVVHHTFDEAAHCHLSPALLPSQRHDLPQLPLTSFPARLIPATIHKKVSIGYLADPTTFTSKEGGADSLPLSSQKVCWSHVSACGYQGNR